MEDAFENFNTRANILQKENKSFIELDQNKNSLKKKLIEDEPIIRNLTDSALSVNVNLIDLASKKGDEVKLNIGNTNKQALISGKKAEVSTDNKKRQMSLSSKLKNVNGKNFFFNIK